MLKRAMWMRQRLVLTLERSKMRRRSKSVSGPLTFRRVLATVLFACIAIIMSTAVAAAKDLPPVKPVIDCTALANMVFADSRAFGRVESAVLKDSEPAPPSIVARMTTAVEKPRPYCEVKGYIIPQVHFELHLPTENWTQRLLFEGCGGFCGAVRLFGIFGGNGCLVATNGEFATVTSDLGHNSQKMMDAVWAADKQLREDFGYRGVNVTTIAAKEIVAKYYGQPQAFAYFDGCSDGGREAMASVERYPNDFNGVIAGAPVVNEVANNTIYHAWGVQKLIRPDGSKVFSDAAMATLHNAALAACDTMNGDPKDGVVPDPPQCHFDPSVIACGKGEPASSDSKCLTPEQVKAAKELYLGAHDAEGHVFYYGYDVGSELQWNKEADGDAAWGGTAGSFPGFLASDPPDVKIDFHNLAFTESTVKGFYVFANELNAGNADLRPLQKAGAKLIIWQGWSDVAVAPGAVLDYYSKLRKTVGPQTDDFVRLYMLPGVSHCGGGDGPDKTELVKTLMGWVEDGIAPGPLTATKRDDEGKVTATRVIQPYK
jgi:hypothetical protein